MTAIRLSPLSGLRPQALVILLHGVGANAESMRAVAQSLQHQLPDVAFSIPTAPERSDLGGTGFQWFSIRGVSHFNRGDRLNAGLPPIEKLIAEELAYYALTHDQLALCGFSQGAMMALALADRPRPPAAIVSIAGRIARPVAAATSLSPAVLLMHGDADTVVPFVCLAEAADTFAAAGFVTDILHVPGLGHQIAHEQLSAIVPFVTRTLLRVTVEQAV